MLKQSLLSLTSICLASSRENLITGDNALHRKQIGGMIFRMPLMGVAAADDALWEHFSQPPEGQALTLPYQWLNNAFAVITLFLPYTASIADYPATEHHPPAGSHLFGPEGKAILRRVADTLTAFIAGEGYEACAPVYDPRYFYYTTAHPQAPYGSNWSERHAGYIAGLGTLGLNNALITAAGQAGRLLSIITDMPLKPTVRAYSRIDAYCNKCGRCIDKCPKNAIGNAGKQHPPCSAFLDTLRPIYHSEYNCSACQFGLPCSHSLP